MTELIQKLREVTGGGVMECKKALEEAGGDFDKAVVIIHERGSAKAEKRKDRSTGAGVLQSYIHNERVGVLFELRSETDFVARSDEFRTLAKELAMQVAAMDPSNEEELMKQPYIKDESKTVEDLVSGVMARTGENVKIGRFCRYEL